jgi:UDP-GlcNAc3NAcA epimerase
MLALENACEFVLTDSGGVQKEAYFCRKPCVTMQDATGWVEQVETGWDILVGSNEEMIYKTLSIMPKYGEEVQLYGDGQTSIHIARTLLEAF